MSANQKAQEDSELKPSTPIVKQMYRLTIEPRVVDQLAKIAARTGEPKTRLATRLFTDAVMSFKPNGRGKAAAKS